MIIYKASLSALTVLVTLSSCAVYAPKTWTKQGFSQDQYSRDALLCRQTAMQNAALNGLTGNMFVELPVMRMTNECLQSLGYYETTPSVALNSPSTQPSAQIQSKTFAEVDACLKQIENSPSAYLAEHAENLELKELERSSVKERKDGCNKRN